MADKKSSDNAYPALSWFSLYVVMEVCSKILHSKVSDKMTFANSADPDQTEQSDQGLHCLQSDQGLHCLQSDQGLYYLPFGK